MAAAHWVAAHTMASVIKTAVTACRARLRLDGIGHSPVGARRAPLGPRCVKGRPQVNWIPGETRVFACSAV